jgi:ribosome modulation factor
MPTVTQTDDLLAGKKDKRLEAAITAGLDAEITARAKELAGGRDPKMFRSAAARDLLVKGALAARRDRARTA